MDGHKDTFVIDTTLHSSGLYPPDAHPTRAAVTANRMGAPAITGRTNLPRHPRKAPSLQKGRSKVHSRKSILSEFGWELGQSAPESQLFLALGAVGLLLLIIALRRA